MSTIQNRGYKLARTPLGGWPDDADFAWFEAPCEAPSEGQALTETIYLSLDPYQWGRRRGGVEQPGEVCHGRTVSRVIESRLGGYDVGDFVFNTNGWQSHGLMGEGISVFNYMFPRKLDVAMAPISTAIGIMGMLGLTAYSGMVVQCQPRPGETVVVSAASGGVGQVAGQLAKILGCRVVGIAGKPAKCRFVTEELGFDACVSHLDPDFANSLSGACPDGIDIYFENVGGAVFEGVLPLLNRNSRISLCGMISQYGNTDQRDAREVWQETGAPYFDRQNVTVHGLFVGNFVADHQEAFLERMGDWVRMGKVKYREDRYKGLEQTPAAFKAMLSGGNFGKTLIEVAADPTLEANTGKGLLL